MSKREPKPSTTAASPRQMIRGIVPRRPLWLPTLLALLYLYLVNQYPSWKDTNACSRVYQTLAIVDDGEFAIDRCLARYGNTQDKAFVDGRHYSDKPPGVAFWLSPWARLLRWFIAVDDFERMFYWLRALGLSLPAALFWHFTWPKWVYWSGSEAGGTTVTLIGALGTGWFAYSTALYAHVPAGILLFAAFLVVRSAREESQPRRRWALALLAGLLCGAAFLCDFVVVLAVPVLGAWLVLSGGTRPDAAAVAAWLAGLAPPLAAWMLYNAACFGGPLETGFLSHSDPSFAEVYRRGWLGMQPPDLAAVPGLLFSPARGLFFFSPALLAAPWGLWRMAKRGEAWADSSDDGGARGEALVCAAVALAVLLFATTTVDWRAGWAYGPRYLMPAAPFLLVGVAAALRQSTVAGPAAVAVAAGGVVGVGWAALGMLTTPLLVQEFRNPMITFCGATLAQGHVARTLASQWLDVWSVLPVVLLVGGVMAWLVVGPLRSVSAAELSLRLRRCGLATIVLAVCQAAIPDWPQAELTQRIQRAELLIRLGYLDAAAAKLKEIDAAVVKRPGAGVAPPAPREAS